MTMEMTMSQLKGDYSPMESTIFEALRKGPATSTDLIRRVYPKKAIEPFNAGIVVNKATISLGEKLLRNREPFRLERKKLPQKRLIENRLVTKKK